MMVTCGVAEQKGNFLICKRSWGVPFAGFWEFPSEEYLEDECIENSVGTTFFDRVSAVPVKTEPFFAFNSSSTPDCRIFAFKVNFLDTKLALNGYDESRWVSLPKLKKYRLFPDCVTIVNEIEKKLQKNVPSDIF